MSKARITAYDRKPAAGRVTLVGAGPGAADLLTLRGQRVLAEADVVIYDDLVNTELLEHCRPEAIRIYVGKRAGQH
jgi:siroheme synthase